MKGAINYKPSEMAGLTVKRHNKNFVSTITHSHIPLKLASI